MRRFSKLVLTTGLFVLATVLAKQTFADNPPPPPGGHGSNGNQAPAGAPIDGGLGILLAMGAAYGCNKLYQVRMAKQNNLM
ncbi:MAG: hypothetical protein M0Q38_13575 [Bacteroidales bacterium]|jgi:hypothetical protein|nr:hypothetical protein [Bacteroidales bacterium]